MESHRGIQAPSNPNVVKPSPTVAMRAASELQIIMRNASRRPQSEITAAEIEQPVGNPEVFTPSDMRLAIGIKGAIMWGKNAPKNYNSGIIDPERESDDGVAIGFTGKGNDRTVLIVWARSDGFTLTATIRGTADVYDAFISKTPPNKKPPSFLGISLSEKGLLTAATFGLLDEDILMDAQNLLSEASKKMTS